MTSHPIKLPKKLIEVALPLDAINEQAAREKSIRHGHPSTLHLWWARRPLAAARAVIFAQLVNDPASLWEMQNPGQTPGPNQRGAFTRRRTALFELISEFVKWEKTTNESLLEKARAEIRRSWREVCDLNKDHPEAVTLFDPDRMPGMHDPFAGGGAIPLEAQRLGLEAYASDLNPVAVLINKAMIEIPPRFAGRPPIHPRATGRTEWRAAEGLAEDVRQYGAWMRDEAEKRIGGRYPKAIITKEIAKARPDLKSLVGQELTVIAWLWARTVRSPNPAFSHAHVPLVTSYVLGEKEGKEAWVEPVVNGSSYEFIVRSERAPLDAKEGTKLPGRGSSFRCVLSGTPIPASHIRSEALAGRMTQRLMAVVAEGPKGRVYLSPTLQHEESANTSSPAWRPETELYVDALGFAVPAYGLVRWGDLFTDRQAATLVLMADLVSEVRKQVESDGAARGLRDRDEYANAISTYMAFVVDKQVESMSSLCTWSSHPKNELVVSTFRRMALSMTWDFAESNPFGPSSGSIEKSVAAVARALDTSFVGGVSPGHVVQCSAQTSSVSGKFISTDPPYYDNIGYADLAEFFYVWLRRSVRFIYPELMSTIGTPKSEELVATPGRHGGKSAAADFFLDGMTSALKRVGAFAHPGAPVTIYYAFKQSESDDNETSSAGWGTFLSALTHAGYQLTGTWPMRTERPNRSRGIESNALASSIVLVCRKRPDNASSATRRQFIRELNSVLPMALDEMTMGAGEGRSPVAPVDLSQAMIGPGMAIFSKYSAVLEADGSAMTVKTALQLINRFLADDDFDADTQFCLRWYEQHGWEPGQFGEADVLARAKGTSVDGLKLAGVLLSDGGKVRLLKQSEYPSDWDPTTDKRLPVWEALHQLIRSFRADGERGAGVVLAAVKEKTDPIRQLAYRLYTLCERRGEAEEARGYNEIVTAWASVERVAEASPKPEKQPGLPGVK